MARRKKRRVRGFRAPVAAAVCREQELRAALDRLGLSLHVSFPVGGSRRSARVTAHFQVNDRHGRLLDWWPGGGKWLSRTQRGVAVSIDELLVVLEQLVGTGAPGPAPAAAVGAAGLVAMLAGQSGGRAA
jgi:hypothetical protein